MDFAPIRTRTCTIFPFYPTVSRHRRFVVCYSGKLDFPPVSYPGSSDPRKPLQFSVHLTMLLVCRAFRYRGTDFLRSHTIRLDDPFPYSDHMFTFRVHASAYSARPRVATLFVISYLTFFLQRRVAWHPGTLDRSPLTYSRILWLGPTSRPFCIANSQGPRYFAVAHNPL